LESGIKQNDISSRKFGSGKLIDTEAKGARRKRHGDLLFCGHKVSV
jgi:hypothetical protein